MSKLENWLKVTNFNLLHPCLKFKFLAWKKWDEYLVLCSTILANFRLVKINHKFNTKCQSIGWKWPTLTHLITFKIRSFCLKKKMVGIVGFVFKNLWKFQSFELSNWFDIKMSRLENWPDPALYIYVQILSLLHVKIDVIGILNAQWRYLSRSLSWLNF